MKAEPCYLCGKPSSGFIGDMNDPNWIGWTCSYCYKNRLLMRPAWEWNKMHTINDDIFTALDNKIQDVHFLVCTTNCMVKNDGTLVMGKGLALECNRRWPGIRRQWGRDQTVTNLKNGGKTKPILHFYRQDHNPYLEQTDPVIIGLPTKIDWRDKSDLRLIEEMLISLRSYFNLKQIKTKCLVPKLGCSNGGLEWSEVRPIMEKYLDDRFICCLNES